MSVGMKWLRRAERAAAARVARLMDRAETEVATFLPGARIERAGDEIRIGARGLLKRWLKEPALRFLWRIK